MRFFAVYEMLEGEDKYTWVKNRCTDEEYESGGRVLALFHYLAHDFDPGDLGREQPPIMQLLRDLRPAFAGYAEQARAGSSIVDQYYLDGCPPSTRRCAGAPSRSPSCRACPASRSTATTTPAISSGSTPTADSRPADVGLVLGLFDFDWSKLDYRIFDVAEGIVYFCSSWEGHDSGELWLDKAAIFVRAYQDEAAQVRRARPHDGGRARRAAAHDRQRQPVRAQLGREAYYEADEASNDDEYLMYLEHQVMFMEFIEAHLDELAAWPRRRRRRRAHRVSTTTGGV